MHWLVLVGFIGAHLLLYVAVLRNLSVFAGERMIAGYHGLAFTIVLVVVAAEFVRGGLGFAAVSGLLALQFIYSISFLELWSLAEGSYSLQLLLRVSQHPSSSREDIIVTCEAIGAEKKRHRLDNLMTLRLVRQSADGCIELSMAGVMLVQSLRAIMRFTAIRTAS